MCEKTRYQWIEEAESFLYEFKAATGRTPDFEDVKKEVSGVDLEPDENPQEYAETLYAYILECEKDGGTKFN